jgi:predicted RecA/RadA family phage recombinase
MAQTPCLIAAEGDRPDYTPDADVAAGDVVLIGTIPAIAPVAIESGVKGSLAITGLYKVPQKAEIITAGDAVYWDATGDPVTGTAGTGAATGTASVYIMGVCTKTTEATDTYVEVALSGAKRTATIGGAVTASDIEAEDATLNVNGLDAAQGGLVAIAGGTSSTGTNAGGAVSATGGTGGAGGDGGAASVTGGVPASGNAAGGAAAVTGGAGSGTGAGGAVTATGGASGDGATGNGGAISVTGGAALSTAGDGGAASLIGGVSTTTGTGGAVTVTSGASAGASGTAGDVDIDCGAAAGGTAGTINIGETNAGAIALGVMPTFPSATVAATGSDQSGAAAIATGITWVTAADGTKGVKLPAAAAGLVCFVKNDDTANAVLPVYPNTDDTINALAANASLDMAAKTSAVFVCYDGTAWFTVPLLPS